MFPHANIDRENITALPFPYRNTGCRWPIALLAALLCPYGSGCSGQMNRAGFFTGEVFMAGLAINLISQGHPEQT